MRPSSYEFPDLLIQYPPPFCLPNSSAMLVGAEPPPPSPAHQSRRPSLSNTKS